MPSLQGLDLLTEKLATQELDRRTPTDILSATLTHIKY
jgi:hypothetical protein